MVMDKQIDAAQFDSAWPKVLEEHCYDLSLGETLAQHEYETPSS